MWVRVILIFFALAIPRILFAMTVVIDAGHGGSDKGATRKSVREADLTFHIAKKLEKLILEDEKMHAILTRNGNKNLTLKNRAQRAQDADGDLLISIHANASPDKQAKGLEIYFQSMLNQQEEGMLFASWETQPKIEGIEINHYNRYPKYIKLIAQDIEKKQFTQESAQFAKMLYQGWMGNKKSRRNTLRQAPFYVISNVQMPAVLVEVGFLTNSAEFQQLQTETYQGKIAQSIFRSLQNYYKDIYLKRNQ